MSVIISLSLTETEEEKLLRVLRDHKAALGWTIADIKVLHEVKVLVLNWE